MGAQAAKRTKNWKNSSNRRQKAAKGSVLGQRRRRWAWGNGSKALIRLCAADGRVYWDVEDSEGQVFQGWYHGTGYIEEVNARKARQRQARG